MGTAAADRLWKIGKFTRAANRAQFLFGPKVTSFLEDRNGDLTFFVVMDNQKEARSQAVEDEYRENVRSQIVFRLPLFRSCWGSWLPNARTAVSSGRSDPVAADAIDRLSRRSYAYARNQCHQFVAMAKGGARRMLTPQWLARTLIRTSSTPSASKPTSRRSPSAGHENPPPGSRDPPEARPSPEGYDPALNFCNGKSILNQGNFAGA